VQSTVIDMAAYGSALLRGSKGVVLPETLALMTSDQYRPDKRLPGWGLAFGVQERGPHRAFGHGGSVFGGWNSYLGILPHLDAAIVLHEPDVRRFRRDRCPTVINAFLGIEEELAGGD
jgi:CubicO group peptidase (beta-lactamase class C family)